MFFNFRIFLHDHSGNPNKTNGKKETSLICVCMEKPENAQFYPVQRKRLDCLMILLKWRGPETEDGERERVNLDSQDEVCIREYLRECFLSFSDHNSMFKSKSGVNYGQVSNQASQIQKQLYLAFWLLNTHLYFNLFICLRNCLYDLVHFILCSLLIFEKILKIFECLEFFFQKIWICNFNILCRMTTQLSIMPHCQAWNTV